MKDQHLKEFISNEVRELYKKADIEVNMDTKLARNGTAGIRCILPGQLGLKEIADAESCRTLCDLVDAIQKSRILECIRSIMVDVLSLPLKEEEITMDAKMIDDLGCDSMDLVELAMPLEEEFEIEIKDEESAQCEKVRDWVSYIQSNLNN